MLTRFNVAIYRWQDLPDVDGEDYDQPEWRYRPDGLQNLESVAAATVAAYDPRLAAAIVYGRTYGGECRALLRELDAPNSVLCGYSGATIWRQLRRSWFYSRMLQIQFHFEFRQLGCTLFFAVEDESGQPWDGDTFPFSRN